MPVLCYVGVGSNLGDRERLILRAKELLSEKEGISFLRSSLLYEPDPEGGPPQGLFLNSVWEIKTTLAAENLLSCLQKIENILGRERTTVNGPRTVDLDILFFDDQVIRLPRLVVPHPRCHKRWFVLKPLWDLRSDLIHPVFKKSVCELLSELNESHQKSGAA